MSVAAAVLLGLTGGCRSVDARQALDSRLEALFDDSSRLEALRAVVARRNAAQDASVERRAELGELARGVNGDHASSSEDLLEVFEEFESAWKQYQDEVYAASLEMRALTTESEWRALADADLESILATHGN